MRRSPTSSAKVRGFTLIELMVVVVIIAVLAVIAVPLFSARMQGRRIMQAAGRIADLYRGSRTRALGRGAAVLVTINVSNTDTTLQVLEGVQGTTAANQSGTNKTACANLPTRGCLTNTWVPGTTTNVGTARVIEGIGNEGLKSTLTLPDGTTLTSGTVGICFSPAGRTYLNRSGTWTATNWTTLNNAAIITIASTNSNVPTPRQYTVLIMPNGTARLAP